MENHFSSCLHNIVLPEQPPCWSQGKRTTGVFEDRSKTWLALSWLSLPTVCSPTSPESLPGRGAGSPRCCRCRRDAWGHVWSCPGSQCHPVRLAQNWPKFIRTQTPPRCGVQEGRQLRGGTGERKCWHCSLRWGFFWLWMKNPASF